jgi:hypothetical protein
MCIKVPGHPRELTLQERRTRNGKTIETYTVALGKVTSKHRNDDHTSSRGFTYPIGKTVHDPNVKIGDHQLCLHFIADPASDKLDEYGSHRLLILPCPQLWDPPGAGGEQPKSKCWHSSGATSLICVDYAKLTPEDLENPEFWESMTKPPKRARKTQKDDDFVLRLPRAEVWHKEREFSRN